MHGGQVQAVHERLQGRFGERLVLDHYLELLQHKPGAFARARALQQARVRGEFPALYDTVFATLKARYGETEGTRQMLKVLLLHRDYSAAQVQAALSQALALGCCQASAITVLVRPEAPAQARALSAEELGALARYGQPHLTDWHGYAALCPSQRAYA